MEGSLNIKVILLPILLCFSIKDNEEIKGNNKSKRYRKIGSIIK